jgi:hypothetical protein
LQSIALKIVAIAAIRFIIRVTLEVRGEEVLAVYSNLRFGPTESEQLMK